MNVFLSGLPNKNSFHWKTFSKSGVNVTNGGDVITKTIRLRYRHIRGWIEDQESIKVRLMAILMMQHYKIISQIGLFSLWGYPFGSGPACSACFHVGQQTDLAAHHISLQGLLRSGVGWPDNGWGVAKITVCQGRDSQNGVGVVGRSLFLLFHNCSAPLCQGPA